LALQSRGRSCVEGQRLGCGEAAERSRRLRRRSEVSGAAWPPAAVGEVLTGAASGSGVAAAGGGRPPGRCLAPRIPRPRLPRPAPQAAEALRRAKFKFPGRQKIVTSRNWGFTPYARDDYVQWKKEGRLVNSGVHATVGLAPERVRGAGARRGAPRAGLQWGQPAPLRRRSCRPQLLCARTPLGRARPRAPRSRPHPNPYAPLPPDSWSAAAAPWRSATRRSSSRRPRASTTSPTTLSKLAAACGGGGGGGGARSRTARAMLRRRPRAAPV
jgi:hypothetical protein